MPRMDKVEWMAALFGVPVTHLIEEFDSTKPDILDEVDIGFYGAFKELSEDDKATVRDMVMLMRERRANKEAE